MKLIIGLGNPEDTFASTRHNIGFWTVDQYVAQHGSHFVVKSRFKSLVAEIPAETGVDKIVVVKPTTYYNLSGESVRAVADFYHVSPQDILIVHDELFLPFGVIRTRRGGGDAGNNGIKSITEHMGPETARLRIGTYNNRRDLMPDADFVLSRFTTEETQRLNEILPRLIEIIDSFASSCFQPTTHSHQDDL